ncbi:IQ and ubiquitin-like domain-containing protein [Cololabis saira]|uniref:IQ and ubiquitin-like domain-containing protein n=1 Tax=Cololabis saira TaxID=129043 RepID=UPI002AD4A3A5|nr:IQ and ubiquitin-like domain-containing protein [Cololabis saira]
MLEPEENAKQGVKEEEEADNTSVSSQPGGAASDSPGGHIDPEMDGEERTDVQQDAEETGSPAENPTDKNSLQETQESQNTENSGGTAVLETVEEAQEEFLVDVEQLEEERENVGSSTATVKVVLEPEGHVVTVAFPIGHNIQELKRHLASELRVPVEVLQLSLDGRVLEEQQSLMELGIRPHSSTRMELSSTEPRSHPLRLVHPPEHDSMPDVLTVQVQTDEGRVQELVVEIERSHQQKAMLGGYRHRLTGAEYHHTGVQTQTRRPDKLVGVFSRDTQTVELKDQTQQSSVSISTQMTRTGCYVSCVNDKLLIPGKYTTADQYHNKRLRAVICLQSYARRWLAQQTVDRLKKERKRRLDWLELQNKRREEEKEEQLRDRRQRWKKPQTRSDINLQYCALEKWRREEEQRINSSLRGAERTAALRLLLEQETRFIAEIERHCISFQNYKHERLIRDLLDKSAAPHQWRADDGRLIEMETQDCIRARELRDLYDNISLSTGSKEQRLHHLMALKHTLMEHDCQLTRDIIELIDREVDLMARAVKAHNLEGLRKRICTLFLQFIKTPAFNPKVAKLKKGSQTALRSKTKSSQPEKVVILCRGCHCYLRSANFTTSACGWLSGWCQHCAGLDNIARSRKDYSFYKNILKKLRDDEQQLNKNAKIPFLLQVEDMWYLVEGVWASRSALSGSRDLYKLVFVRWDRRSDWSPWNCILLCKEETAAHLQLTDIQKAYKKTFICEVERKHTMARRHFSNLPDMVKCMDPQPDVAMGDTSASKSVTMATGQHASDTTTVMPH